MPALVRSRGRGIGVPGAKQAARASRDRASWSTGSSGSAVPGSGQRCAPHAVHGRWGSGWSLPLAGRGVPAALFVVRPGRRRVGQRGRGGRCAGNCPPGATPGAGGPMLQQWRWRRHHAGGGPGFVTGRGFPAASGYPGKGSPPPDCYPKPPGGSSPGHGNPRWWVAIGPAGSPLRSCQTGAGAGSVPATPSAPVVPALPGSTRRTHPQSAWPCHIGPVPPGRWPHRSC